MNSHAQRACARDGPRVSRLTILRRSPARYLLTMANRMTRWGGYVCLLLGCSSVDSVSEQPEALASASQALASGVQGFARFDSTGATLSSITTIGTAIDASRTSLGRYQVTFHSLAAFSPTVAGQGGVVQIVAVGPDNVRCTLASNWTFNAAHDVVAKVACRAPGVGPADSGFFAEFGRGPGSSGAAAYARVAADASVASATQYSSSGGTISASHPATGGYFVFMSAGDRQSVQVTAISTSAHCHASLRELGVTTVRCFSDSGVPVDAAFAINQAGTTGLALYGAGAFAQVKSTGSLDTRYDFNSCGLGETTGTRLSAGRYEVSHTAVGSSMSSYQLSAYSDDDSYCKVDAVSLTGTTAKVTAQCYSTAGAARDSALVESYAVGIPPSTCQPTTLAAAPTTTPTSVGANASTVWFTSITDVTTSPGLVSVSRSGGPSSTLVSGAHAHWFNSVLVTPSFVYWLDGSTSPEDISLYRKPLVGGTPQLVLHGGIHQQRQALAYAGGFVYFADSTGASVIWKIDALGGSTRLWPSNASTSAIYPDAITVAGTRAYFLRDTGDQLKSVPVSGGTPTLLASSSGGFTHALTTDGTYLYWAVDGSPGTIFKTPLGGGTTTSFAGVGGVVTGLATDATYLYFAVTSPGKVGRIALNDVFATPRTIAGSEDAPSSIFVDSGGVLWTTSHAVRMLSR